MNVASVAATLTLGNTIPYGPSKAGTTQLLSECFLLS